jgi:trimeric autotransporter adhesin
VGATTITATSGVIDGSTTLTVTSATLVSIAVTPDNPSIADGLTQQFIATGTYTDASTQDLTTVVTWLSSDTGKATISNAAGSNGLATASEIGVTTITAVSGLISDSTTLTVTPAELQFISIAPANASVPLGLTQQYTATGHYTDASTQGLTATVTWSSSDTGVATISNVGLVTTVAEGSTTITVTLDALSANTSLTVTPVALVSIALTPANSTQPRNSSFQMTATGTFSNGLTSDVTNSADWISSFPSKIDVNNTTNKGLVSVGSQPNQTVTITATVGSVSSNTQVSSNN